MRPAHLALLLISLVRPAWAEPDAQTTQAIPVEVVATDDGWRLTRGGDPYRIHGAGGSGSLTALAAAGANSVRTWGVDETTGDFLDRAHAAGLTVTVGIWLGHERHGFDYSDPEQVAAQKEHARKAVLAHKDHPALLMWGVGNEMEGFQQGDNPKVWAAVEDIAAMIQELDPNHPTLTVTAEIGGARVASVRDLCPSIDVHGVNAYGGGASVPERYRKLGGTKPLVLTEFGPVGSWETTKTEWGAPLEGTSDDKAAAYRKTWTQAVQGAPDLTLGGYAFTWGYKMEATATWFGMLLPDGQTVAAVDTMTELWTGKPAADRSPEVTPITLAGPDQVEPGDMIEASWTVKDPEGAPVTVTWALRPESGEYATGGDSRPMLRDIEGAIVQSSTTTAKVRMPDAPGQYRLHVLASDGTGHAATANRPLLVKGDPRPLLPMAVYQDGQIGPWAPSGWMGSIDAVELDTEHTKDCHQGDKCIEIRYGEAGNWAGIAWQNPANNWGDHEGGVDVTGARFLEFWARSEPGGVSAEASVGLLGDDKAHPDSTIVKREGLVLDESWTRYRIKLKRKDLSSLKTGFVISWTGKTTPLAIYLDDIRFVP